MLKRIGQGLMALGIACLLLGSYLLGPLRAQFTETARGLSGGSSSCAVGDIKHGFQVADHANWIRMDGRLKTALSAPRQTEATNLGIGANLPNIADRSVVGASGTKQLNGTGGAETAMLARNQLPNAALAVSGSFSGSSPAYNWSGTANGGSVPSFATQSANQVSAAIPVSGSISGGTESINGGVSQQPMALQNPYLALNGFICLGP